MKALIFCVFACGTFACARTPRRAVVEVSPNSAENFDVAVQGRLASSCGMSKTRVTYYDAKDDGLARIADCLTSGALAGQTVTVSGSTDTRGKTVASYLNKKGVALERITLVRRGTLSSGMSETETDRENDRKVELSLSE